MQGTIRLFDGFTPLFFLRLKSLFIQPVTTGVIFHPKALYKEVFHKQHTRVTYPALQ